ncbi:hypothetical protein SAY86_022399 [Trapa natans]|uniref:Uncharacterized protein n=1 Tax=Trapa natans TaxID=22666 RepID=A0AAN7LU97_TRANT|nr:hypothetical protein SAY86_022399 [Trapa natans]
MAFLVGISSAHIRHISEVAEVTSRGGRGTSFGDVVDVALEVADVEGPEESGDEVDGGTPNAVPEPRSVAGGEGLPAGVRRQKVTRHYVM